MQNFNQSKSLKFPAKTCRNLTLRRSRRVSKKIRTVPQFFNTKINSILLNLDFHANANIGKHNNKKENPTIFSSDNFSVNLFIANKILFLMNLAVFASEFKFYGFGGAHIRIFSAKVRKGLRRGNAETDR
jgi:hypothetical protein